MRRKEERIKPKRDIKVYSFFVLAFPTIIIVALANLVPVGGFGWIGFIEILLAAYQFINLKQFLDSYYDTIGQ